MAMEMLINMGKYPTTLMKLELNLTMDGIGVKRTKDEVLELYV